MDIIIKKDPKFKEILNILLGKIYNYKIQGINNIICQKFHNKDDIFMTRTASDILENIRIDIIKLSFLNSIRIGRSRVFYENLFGVCVECGLVKAQHKYKNCGHQVCHDCALIKVRSTNKCKKCNKPIIKKKIKIIKDKQKETCSICLDDCNTKLFKCGHYFHKKCIEASYKTSKKCPMCRDDIVDIIKKEKHIDTEFDLGNNCGGLVNIFLYSI